MILSVMSMVIDLASKETVPSENFNSSANISIESERHKSYLVDRSYRSSTEDDAIRDESETTRLHEKRANKPSSNSRQNNGTIQGKRSMSSNGVKMLDKYIVPSRSSIEQPNLAGTTIRVLLKTSVVAARAQKWDNVLRLSCSQPEILLARCQEEDNQTLLHVIAGGAPVPKIVVTKIMNTSPEAVSYTDNDGCLPLHHACSVMKRE